MTLRCSCTDDEHTVVDGGWRDPIVFGRCRTCGGDPPAQSTLPKLVPSSWFVVPAEEPVLRDRWDMCDDERRD